MRGGKYVYTVNQNQWAGGQIYEHIIHNSLSVKALTNMCVRGESWQSVTNKHL